jgi:hypothetical protein
VKKEVEIDGTLGMLQQSADHRNGLTDHGKVKLVELKHF